jgi:hypothetical protein
MLQMEAIRGNIAQDLLMARFNTHTCWNRKVQILLSWPRDHTCSPYHEMVPGTSLHLGNLKTGLYRVAAHTAFRRLNQCNHAITSLGVLHAHPTADP